MTGAGLGRDWAAGARPSRVASPGPLDSGTRG